MDLSYCFPGISLFLQQINNSCHPAFGSHHSQITWKNTTQYFSQTGQIKPMSSCYNSDIIIATNLNLIDRFFKFLTINFFRIRKISAVCKRRSVIHYNDVKTSRRRKFTDCLPHMTSTENDQSFRSVKSPLIYDIFYF